MPEALATGIDSGFVELLLKGVEVVDLKQFLSVCLQSVRP